jgi:hypothetical protein
VFLKKLICGLGTDEGRDRGAETLFVLFSSPLVIAMTWHPSSSSVGKARTISMKLGVRIPYRAIRPELFLIFTIDLFCGLQAAILKIRRL